MATVSNAVDVIEARKAAIGDGAEVRRLLPQRTLRTIGAWCFLDHYGPDEVSRGHGMSLAGHVRMPGHAPGPFGPDGRLLARDRLVGHRDQRGGLGEDLLLRGQQPARRNRGACASGSGLAAADVQGPGRASAGSPEASGVATVIAASTLAHARAVSRGRRPRRPDFRLIDQQSNLLRPAAAKDAAAKH